MTSASPLLLIGSVKNRLISCNHWSISRSLEHPEVIILSVMTVKYEKHKTVQTCSSLCHRIWILHRRERKQALSELFGGMGRESRNLCLSIPVHHRLFTVLYWNPTYHHGKNTPSQRGTPSYVAVIFYCRVNWSKSFGDHKSAVSTMGIKQKCHWSSVSCWMNFGNSGLSSNSKGPPLNSCLLLSFPHFNN